MRWFLFAAMLTGCTTPQSQPKDQPAASAKAGKNGGAAKAAKGGKEAKAGKGEKTEKTAKTGDKAERGAKGKAGDADPIGVAGAATGVLQLVPVTAPAPAAGATAPPAGPHTEAKLTLTFADGSVTPLSLGKINGTCSEKAPAPVGAAGEQVTPLWAVGCKDAAGKVIDLAILQKGDALTVLRAVPNAAGGAPEQKVVKRVKLASGATVAKKTG